jgi:hypothetical protein
LRDPVNLSSLDEDIQEYIAGKTENCTPAQLQEIIYSLVIQYSAEQSELLVNKADIDGAISRVNGRNQHRLGFNSNDNHNGHKPNFTGTQRLA